jgi:hypothetical protein
MGDTLQVPRFRSLAAGRVLCVCCVHLPPCTCVQDSLSLALRHAGYQKSSSSARRKKKATALNTSSHRSHAHRSRYVLYWGMARAQSKWSFWIRGLWCYICCLPNAFPRAGRAVQTNHSKDFRASDLDSYQTQQHQFGCAFLLRISS